MKLKGGYNVLLKECPEGGAEVSSEPEVLYLPVHSRRVSAGDTKIHPELVILGAGLLGAIIR